MNRLISKVALGAVMAGALMAGSATASFAFGGDRYYYEPGANGSVWSFYPGYFDGQGARVSTFEAPRSYDWNTPDQQQTRRRQHPVRQRQGRDDDSQ
jgi:hypothetical protein